MQTLAELPRTASPNLLPEIASAIELTPAAVAAHARAYQAELAAETEARMSDVRELELICYPLPDVAVHMPIPADHATDFAHACRMARAIANERNLRTVVRVNGRERHEFMPHRYETGWGPSARAYRVRSEARRDALAVGA